MFSKLLSNIKFRFFFLVLIFFSILLLMIRFYLGGEMLIDSEEYLATSKLISSLNYFKADLTIEGAKMLTKRPFVYPLFMLLCFDNIYIILFMQWFLFVTIIYMFVYCYRKLGGEQLKVNRILFFLFTPSVFIYTTLIMSEIMVSFLVMCILSLLLSELSIKKKTLFLQILVILLAFTKPVFYLFVGVNFLFCLFFLLKSKFYRFIYMPIIPVFFVISYMGFNKFRTGVFHYSSIQQINLIHYNVYSFETYKYGLDIADHRLDSIVKSSITVNDFYHLNSTYNNYSSQVIGSNFIDYFSFHLKGAIRGLFDPGKFDLLTFKQLENYSGNVSFLNSLNEVGLYKTIILFSLSSNMFFIVFLTIVFGFIILKYILAIRFIISNKSTMHYGVIYVLVLFFYTIILSGPINSSRFMMPFQFFIILLATLGLEKSKMHSL